VSEKETIDLGQMPEEALAGAGGAGEADPVVGAPASIRTAEPGSDAGPEVHRAEFQPLAARAPSEASGNLGRLMDVVVSITIELGTTEMPLGQVLELGSGSVVKLDRVVGEPVDILVNHELVGQGEVVVVDDCFGVRVTQLVDAQEERKWNGGRVRNRGAWPW
jgi:flagellar motor switch protein FliN/FliY